MFLSGNTEILNGPAGINQATTENIIRGLYNDILKRAPSQAEIDYWVGAFGPTVDVNEIAAFQKAAAPEVASTAALTNTANIVKNLYQETLKRQAKQDELAWWVAQFGESVDPAEIQAFKNAAGPEIAANEKAVKDAKAQADAAANAAAAAAAAAVDKAFWNDSHNTEVISVFQDSLYRDPTKQEVIKWVNSGLHGDELANAIIDSFAPKMVQVTQVTDQGTKTTVQIAAQQTAEVISLLYRQMLDRTPTQAESNYWNNAFGPTIDANEIAAFKMEAQKEIGANDAKAAAAAAAAAARAANDAYNAEIEHIFVDVLHRSATEADLAYWKSTKARGENLRANIIDAAYAAKELKKPTVLGPITELPGVPTKTTVTTPIMPTTTTPSNLTTLALIAGAAFILGKL